MFDLHSHTIFSDGELDPKELLKKMYEENISICSITDHNHCLAYEDLKVNEDIKYIVGTEIATSYKGYVIEILGYEVDYSIINKWYREYYSDDNLIKREKKLFSELKEISKKNGFEIDSNFEMEKIVKGQSKKTIYYYLKENYKDFSFNNYKDFFRKGLSNPSSIWFIDEGRYYPTIKEVIDLIHSAGGKAILAHPYEYGFDNLNELFSYLIDSNIDGIESFHPSASMYEGIKIAKYCVDNNLYSSGGSDYHNEKRLVPLGIRIVDKVFNFKCFDWIREYL